LFDLRRELIGQAAASMEVDGSVYEEEEEAWDGVCVRVRYNNNM